MAALSLSVFRFLPCYCQCRLKRYIAKQTNSKTEETILLWGQPAFSTPGLLSFLSPFDVASHKSDDSFFLSFFFFTLIFSFFKDYNKIWQRSHLPFAQSAWAEEYPDSSLQRGNPPPNECPGHDTTQYDGEVLAVLELWGMLSTPSLQSLPCPFWPGVAAPDKGPINWLNRTKLCFHYTDFCI